MDFLEFYLSTNVTDAGLALDAAVEPRHDVISRSWSLIEPRMMKFLNYIP